MRVNNITSSQNISFGRVIQSVPVQLEDDFQQDLEEVLKSKHKDPHWNGDTYQKVVDSMEMYEHKKDDYHLFINKAGDFIKFHLMNKMTKDKTCISSILMASANQDKIKDAIDKAYSKHMDLII